MRARRALWLLIGAACGGCSAIVGFPDRELETQDAAPGDATPSPDAPGETGDGGGDGDDGGDAADASKTFCQLQDGASFCDDFESLPLDASWVLHTDTLKGSITVVPDPADAGNHVLQISAAADSPAILNSTSSNALYLSRDTDGSTGPVFFQFDVAVQNPTSDAGQEVMEILQLYGKYLRMVVAGESVTFTQYFYDAGEAFTPAAWPEGGGFHTVTVSLVDSLLTVTIDGSPAFAANPTYYFYTDQGLSFRLGNTELPADAGAQQVQYDNVLYVSP